MQLSNVYIMLTSNGLTKIGKANNVELRRMQLEQNANMFNIEKRITVEIIKCYPLISERIAFALESYLHEHFSGCQALSSSKEVFIVDTKEVIRIADTWASAFVAAQTAIYEEILFKQAKEDKEVESTFHKFIDGFNEE